MRALKICALALLSFSPFAASAAPHGNDDVDTRIYRADAVVEGTVQRIEFVQSQGDAAMPGVPHTFVTYRVERVFKGRVRGETVTLRFFGGMDAAGDELVFTSDGVQVDVGDHDVLFIAGNGEAECPLVDCAAGRYRIIRDGVYDEAGRDVVPVDESTLSRGTVRDLPEVFTWPLVGLEDVFERRPLSPVAGATMRPEAFRAFISDRIEQLHAAGDAAPIVMSADPAAPFAYRHPAAVPPPGVNAAGGPLR